MCKSSHRSSGTCECGASWHRHIALSRQVPGKHPAARRRRDSATDELPPSRAGYATVGCRHRIRKMEAPPALPLVGSQTRWRMAMPLPATLQNSHQNGGRVFLIFVADPRTIPWSQYKGLHGDVSTRRPGPHIPSIIELLRVALCPNIFRRNRCCCLMSVVNLASEMTR